MAIRIDRKDRGASWVKRVCMCLMTIAGIQYDWTRNVTVGAAYEFIDLGSARINQQGGLLQGDLQGEYGTNQAHVFAADLIWKF